MYCISMNSNVHDMNAESHRLVRTSDIRVQTEHHIHIACPKTDSWNTDGEWWHRHGRSIWLESVCLPSQEMLLLWKILLRDS